MTGRSEGGRAWLTPTAGLVAALVLLLGLTAWGVYDLRAGNSEILHAVTTTPASSGILFFDYVDMNGDPRHVEVRSLAGEEPRATMLRLRALTDESLREYPRRR